MLAATMERWDSEASRHVVEQNLRVGALPWVAHARYEYAGPRFGPGPPIETEHRKEVTENHAIAQPLGMKNIEAKASARSRRGTLKLTASYYKILFIR